VTARATWQPEIVLRDVSPHKRVDIDAEWIRIVREVAEEHGVTSGQVFSRLRRPSVSRARRHAWYRMRSEFRLSWPELARVSGSHHTSCMVGAKLYAREQGIKAFDIHNGRLRMAERNRLVGIIESLAFTGEERCVVDRILEAIR
jgi:hypothetical protein